MLNAGPRTPILQFGTSRFLQAHADLFISEALAQGKALGQVTVAQTTANPASASRVAALAGGGGYPVRIQGLEGGVVVDETRQCHAIAAALSSAQDWPALRALFNQVQVVLSNTGDSGYQLAAEDGPQALAAQAPAPVSFPAKLLVLLHGRWQANPEAPLSLFPCELVVRNGEVLRGLVSELALSWQLPAGFIDYLHSTCRWANALVDRIVSAPLQPVGAVAEPYALWAIERQPGLQLPCEHPAMVLTDNLEHYEHLKLFLLNLGHSWLAERWLCDARPATETVYQALQDAALNASLESLWAEEVLPVFAARGQLAAARDYLASLRERLGNPFLEHRLADIAQHHGVKKQRRFGPVLRMGAQLPGLAQPRLAAALARG